MNKVKILPQTKVIIDRLFQVETLAKLSKEKINDNLLEAIHELVNIYIRRGIRNTNFKLAPQKVIDQAFENVKQLFQYKLQKEDIVQEEKNKIASTIDFYLKDIILQNLYEKPSSRQKSFYEYLKDLRLSINQEYREVGEIQLFDISYQDTFFDIDIGRNLNQYKHEQLISEKSRIEFSILEIGFNNFLEGLLVNPLINELQEYSIDLVNIPQGFYLMENIFNAFPFEISYESSFIYILDDDGTIFLFVENFPPESLIKAGQLLVDLAISLYK